MSRITKQLLLIFLSVSEFFNFVSSNSENSSLKIKELVNNYGYPFEIYHVETKDGYILELHRIPYSFRRNQSEEKKSVVFLKHGLADSSAAFLFAGPNVSLAYILADKGYDVWLGNHRGNSFSRKHKIYKETNHKFWNFSLHEIGLYDNTAMIDYILSKTNQMKLFHVCHSEGCAEFYAMTSLKPEYNDKISLSINLAPGLLFGHSTLRTKSFFTLFYIFKDFFDYFGHIKVLDGNLLLRTITHIFCRPESYLQFLCDFIINLIYGFDKFNFDPILLHKYLNYYPAGASSKQVMHYASSVLIFGAFREYDYGKKKNIKVYNATLPPKYPLDKVTVPVIIYYGDSDNLVTVKDVEQLLKLVPNLIKKKLIKDYNHIDYFVNKNAGKLIYENVLQIFQNYTK